jgi:hypothetical protein
MSGMQYTPAEEHLIRRRFNAGASDADIAHALSALGRSCGAEAVRKKRRDLGLKKVPSYRRWTWVPEGQVFA